MASHGEEIRKHVLANLDYYLYELSENVAKRGGHVFFAQTAEEANDYIVVVAKEKQAKKIVKAKSMVTEEIDLNHHLASIGCEVIETDLGEYILQLDDHEPPSHIVTPALHKNKEQIRDVFASKTWLYKVINTRRTCPSCTKRITRAFSNGRHRYYRL